MADVFGKVLELSWQAGLIALAVMAVRFLLRGRVARRWLCLLWALVALRLVLPVSLTVESPMSLQAAEAPVSQAYHEMQRTAQADAPAAMAIPRETAGAVAAADTPSLVDVLPWIWLAGTGCMLLYMAASLLWMRLSLRQAVRVEGNVYRCGRWRTPFVLGVFAPRIYVPETVTERDLPQVLAHEQCHIRRWDHVWKPLAFVLLAVNWFHPVLWAAYALLGRDMENACDEMALQHADTAQRAAYSRALVSCAAQQRMAAVCPLAFGEVAVKERVKNQQEIICGMVYYDPAYRGGGHRCVPADKAQQMEAAGRRDALRAANGEHERPGGGRHHTGGAGYAGAGWRIHDRKHR